MQDGGQQPMGGGGVVPVKMVIDSVVRNAMDKLIEKQQQLRTGSQSRRRIELVRYLEETRRQFVSLLGLLRWQQKRLPITRKCEDLIESLLHQQTHMKNTSERLCVAAETMAHIHRTPMYDMRTAVDVLASGTYRSLPSMDTQHFLPPKLSTEQEREEVMKQLDFRTRTELLKIKMPPDFTKFEVKDGKLFLESEDEFELELSLSFDQPDRRWQVERAQILVRAEGNPPPQVDWLASMLQSRMTSSEEPLVDAASFMADCLRFRTWQILKAQSVEALSQPKVDIEAAPNGLSFTITYWQEVPPTSFESLMTAAVRGSMPPERKLNISSGSDPRSRPPPPCLVFILSREGCSRVQVRHYPRLVDDKGQIWDIPIKRSALSLDKLLQRTVFQHCQCRLRQLYQRMQAAAAMVAPAGITASITAAADEIRVLLDGKERLGIVVDTRSGELEVRDLAARWTTGGGAERLQQSLQRLVGRQEKDGEGVALLAWRQRDMLQGVGHLAPSLGVSASAQLLAYSHVQAQALSDVLGEGPAMFLDAVGCSLLDSGYKDAAQPVPKAASQEMVTVVVSADPLKRSYLFRLLILSVVKGSKPVVEKILPLEEAADGAAADGSRKRARAGERGGGEEVAASAAEQLTEGIERAKARINLLKLTRQLDTQGIQYRDVEGTILLRVPCAPLPCRELRMHLMPRNRSAVSGGVDGWGLEMCLTAPVVAEGLPTVEKVAAGMETSGTLEEVVRVRGESLLLLFPTVHAESVRELRQVLDGLVSMAKLTTALHTLLNHDHTMQDFGVPANYGDASFPASTQRQTLHDLSGAIRLEAVGVMSAAVRLIESDELVVFQYKPKRGFHVSMHSAGAAGCNTRELVHPLLGSIEQTLDTQMDVKGVLVALVRAEPVLVALRNLATCPGDLSLLPYTLGGFGIVFRGCFGLHIRYALDDTDAYSCSDICPHTTQRPVPGPLEQGFMAHARHTAATITSTADSLWSIPNWRVLIAAVTDAANVVSSTGAPAQRTIRAEEAAVGHYEAQRSSLVVGLAGLETALKLLHAHLASQHMLLMAQYYMAPSRWPARASPVDLKTLAFGKGKTAFALEMSPPSSDARNPSKLELRVKPNPKAQPNDPAIADSDLQHLQMLFGTTIAAAPYAPNRLRSFLHILSLPPVPLKAFVEVATEVKNTAGMLELALAPMYCLPGTETKESGQPTGGLKRGAVTISPRTDKAAGVVHDGEKNELHFAIRMWVCERPAVEACFTWAFDSNKLSCTALQVLGSDSAAVDVANRISDSLESTKGALDVQNGQLWETIKNLVGSVNVVPPPAPLSI